MSSKTLAVVKDYIIFFLVGFSFLLATYSCSDEPNDPIIAPDNPEPLTIAQISPEIGPPGAIITISGTGFDHIISGNFVSFTGSVAIVIEANDSTLTTKVPEGANSGRITVEVGDQTVDGPEFTVTPKPVANQLNPSEGSILTHVTIEGENFNSVEGESDSLIVRINNSIAPWKRRSDTEIEVIIPSDATTGLVSVTLRGSTIEAGTFDVTPLQLTYSETVSVTTLVSIENLSNVFVTKDGETLLSTDTQILRLNSDNSTTVVAGIKGTSSYVDGSVSEATFGNPYQIVENDKGELLVSDITNKAIRKITNDEVTTYFHHADFLLQFGIGIDKSDNLYIADFTPTLWKLSSDKNLSVLAQYQQIPQSISILSVDSDDNIYPIATHEVLKVSPDGAVSTIAGSGTPGIVDGPGNMARFSLPLGLAISPTGDIYLADADNFLIRKISNGTVTTVCGLAISEMVDGDVNTAKFKRPTSIAFDQDGYLLVVDDESALRRIEIF